MKIIKVIPLSRGVFKETLSYFSSKDAPVGSIVSVLVRKKKIDALVIRAEDVSKSKSEIRSSSFAMKKIENVKAKFFFLPEFVNAAEQTARYFATTTGQIVQALTPKNILTDMVGMSVNNNEKIKRKDARTYVRTDVINDEKEIKNVAKSEVLVFQDDDNERIATYKSIIREEFAKGSSVFLCLPSHTDIEMMLDEIVRGIKEYVFVLHGKISKKQIVKIWKAALEEPHPILIISTGSFFSIPRKDIGTIILDKENSQNYKTFSRPYFDVRLFAEMFARYGHIKLILGDTLLRPETIWRMSQNELIELSPLKFRVVSTATQNIADMREYKKSGMKKNFRLISDELKDIIQKNKLLSENLFIFVPRKGLATITLCNDCGEIVKCDECKVPTILHKSKTGNKNNMFICHRCGKEEDAERRCSNCDGWRLSALGIGIEGVEDEIRGILPDVTIFKIDSDTIKTQKKASEIMDKFFTSPGSIMLGTQMALPYLSNKNLDSVVALGMDSLFSVPNFRVREKIFSMLLYLKTRASKNFLIQTRNPEEKVFTEAIKGNLLDFYNDEIDERKKFGYPPFSVFIKITRSGRKDAVNKDVAKLANLLKLYSPNTYPSFPTSGSGGFVMNILIRLKRGEWIDDNLLELLLSLPPIFKVQVDPIDLL